MKYCPECQTKLLPKLFEGTEKLSCPKPNCDFVFWDNPIPVALGIVETSKGIVLAHNRYWPSWKYSVITGFIDTKETPDSAIAREVHEELGLTAKEITFVGLNLFERLNQLIVAFHVYAEGKIALNYELDDYKYVSTKELAEIPFGDGSKLAIKEWLKNQ